MDVFDVETNGLMFHQYKGKPMDTVHCICVYNIESGKELRANTNDEEELIALLEYLQEAPDICGQNIIDYDIPAIQLVYPWFKPKGRIWDTKVMSQVIYPNMYECDIIANNKGKGIPKKLWGRHSLESWGERLGFPKDDYQQRCKDAGIDPWAEWNQDMEDYCAQDVLSTWKLLEFLLGKGFPDECIELEHGVARIITRQQKRGVLFDEEAAGEFYAILLQKQQDLITELRQLFPPWEQFVKTIVPKRDNKRYGYKEGVPVDKYRTVEFNPNSSDHVAHVLKTRYKWRPRTFTNSGKPEITEEILKDLTKYEGVEKIIEYMVVTKRISQLAEGNQAWLKQVRSEDGRIHGSVNINGAITGRMTHSKPNMAQVPASRSPYGKECRALFIVPDGYKLVGCDADGLELRCLGHYMARYDGGKYAKTVVEGNKDDGTDAHSINQKAIGITTRDGAKTWIYAYMYGAREYKLGTIIHADLPDGKRKPVGKSGMVQLGQRSVSLLAKRMPALPKLKHAVESAARKRGWLRGLDGRRIPIRSKHASLNTLLQSAGAVIMKKALVLLDEQLRECNYIPGQDYEFVLNVHDEFQLEVVEEHADDIAERAAESIKKAGEYFNFRCPLAGSSVVGTNWCETH